jgi:hypothetical protein
MDAQPDARVDGSPQRDADADVAVRDVAVSDAAVRPDARIFDFCGEPVFKLPFDGSSDDLIGQEIEGDAVYYNRQVPSGFAAIWRFEIDACRETQLTTDEYPIRFDVRDSTVVMGSYANYDTQCRDLVVFNLDEMSSKILVDSTACESMPRTNGRHVAYQYYTEDMEPGVPELRLLDMLLGTVQVLPIGQGRLKSVNLSERYLVFSDYNPGPESEGSDVFLHEFATGETRRIDASLADWQDWVFVWGDYVTWSGAAGDYLPPYNLVLYNVITDQSELLLDEDYAVGIAPIRSGLIVYDTTRYSGSQGLAPSDIEVFDIETRVVRRVTQLSGVIRAARIDPPYLVFVKPVGAALNYDLYVANLEALGVLDASGHVVPGDGVLEVP